MGEMELDKTDRFRCRICGNEVNNEHFVVKEKMFGSNELFDYFKCSQCGCMQLLDEKMDMSKYYEGDYYSFNVHYKPNLIRDFLGKEFFKYKLGHFSVFGYAIDKMFPSKMQNWLDKDYIKFEDSILDVGCGSGRLLQLMRHRGFHKLRGLDPFNSEVINYGEDLVIYNHSIFEEHNKYDLIMLHYSFEHMPDPYIVFSKLNDLLNDNGTLLIRIPLIDSYSWRKYGTTWVQMDAPRHIYVHTVNSFVYLSKKCGFDVKKILYDSGEYQFLYSEKYLRGYSFDSPVNVFSKKELKKLHKFSLELNKIHDGDQATFYLKRL